MSNGSINVYGCLLQVPFFVFRPPVPKPYESGTHTGREVAALFLLLPPVDVCSVKFSSPMMASTNFFFIPSSHSLVLSATMNTFRFRHLHLAFRLCRSNSRANTYSFGEHLSCSSFSLPALPKLPWLVSMLLFLKKSFCLPIHFCSLLFPLQLLCFLYPEQEVVIFP